MNISVNGEIREYNAGTTISALLRQMNLSQDKVAIELNRRLIRSEKYSTELKDGDQVEIVTFVGGG